MLLEDSRLTLDCGLQIPYTAFSAGFEAETLRLLPPREYVNISRLEIL